MQWFDNLYGIEADITSYCNAACPSCRRTWHVEDIPLQHFNLDVWKRLWEVDLKGKRVDKLVLNGNWGDALMHKDILKILEYPHKHNPNINLMIDTNGGIRDVDFWTEFAIILNKNYINPHVRFGIDGTTNETNHQYRVDVSYDKAIENAQAFINAGGMAQWKFTVFDHNVHQLAEARTIAKDMGFFVFHSRKSYARNIWDKHDTVACTTACYDTHDHAELFVMDINKDKKVHKNVQPNEKPLGHTCPWYNTTRIQIDPWASIWPCCHISGAKFNVDDDDTQNIQQDSWKSYGRSFNNLNVNSLQSILDTDFFKKDVADAVQNATWNECIKSCGIGK